MIRCVSAPILQVVTDTDRRGAQVFATDLHRAFEHAGRSVHTVALAPGTTGGLDLPVLGARRLSPRTLHALRVEVKRSCVVLAHGSTTLPACAIATLGSGVPFVYRQISDSRFWAPSGLRRARVRTAIRRAAAVVALWDGSARTVREHLGVPTDRIHVIPNAVESERFQRANSADRLRARERFGLASERFTVLYVGALAREKGVDRLVDAAGSLPELQFLIIGDGPEHAALEERAESTGAPVSFAGSMTDPRDGYRAADLLVFPSRGGDSMPAVLIEAGLCGLPCIATDIEAIPEIVVEGVTGSVLDRGADDRWAEAIEGFARDPDRGRVMGDAARAHCEARFDIDVVAAQWMRVVDGL